MPTKYVKKGQTPEGRAKRLRIFKHNSFRGYASLTIKQMDEIIRSPTATVESKQLASRIQADAHILSHTLINRVDPVED